MSAKPLKLAASIVGDLTALLLQLAQSEKNLIKQKSSEIRDKNRSQTQQNQYQSYASAATTNNAGINATRGGGTGGGGGMPGLTKKETKDITTTIMSAIVYSHYVEAIAPGTFQKNMSEMYKLSNEC